MYGSDISELLNNSGKISSRLFWCAKYLHEVCDLINWVFRQHYTHELKCRLASVCGSVWVDSNQYRILLCGILLLVPGLGSRILPFAASKPNLTATFDIYQNRSVELSHSLSLSIANQM